LRAAGCDKQSESPLNKTGNNEERRSETTAFSIGFALFFVIQSLLSRHWQMRSDGRKT
jgi:hypothetical protein